MDARGRLLSTREAYESHEAIAECDSSFSRLQPVKDVFLDLLFAVNHSSLPLWIALEKLRLHN